MMPPAGVAGGGIVRCVKWKRRARSSAVRESTPGSRESQASGATIARTASRAGAILMSSLLDGSTLHPLRGLERSLERNDGAGAPPRLLPRHPILGEL